MTCLETQRLRLRPFRGDDVDEVVRWVADPAFVRYLGGPWSRERVLEMFERMPRHHAEHGFGPLAVEDRDTGALVGRSGLAYHAAWPDDPELGWWIAPEQQGRGFATEAGAACAARAFDGLRLPRLVSIALEQNLASRRVMEKLGFRLQARVARPEGELWVHVLEPASFASPQSR